jgi:cell division septation protein DedD
VQIGATPFRERAEQTVQGLRKKGFDAYVSGKSSPYRIRVRARSEQDAERTAARLKRLGHKVWITTE